MQTATRSKLTTSIPGISTVQTPDRVRKDGETIPGTIFFVGTECEHWAPLTTETKDCRFGCLAKAAKASA